MEYAKQELYPVKRQLIGDLAKLSVGYVPLGDEWSQMKMDIARALLKDDTLNDTEG